MFPPQDPITLLPSAPEASPRAEGWPSCRARERSFFIRMKSTLAKRGLHVKASGYKVGASCGPRVLAVGGWGGGREGSPALAGPAAPRARLQAPRARRSST